MTERTIQAASTLSGWRKSSYSNSDGGSCLEVIDGWRKSSYSDFESASCLEVMYGHPTAVPVRDSKNPAGPALLIPAAAWGTFVEAVKRRSV